ncbi:MAG: hypothetical protein JWP25_1169 [Bradyrhizobium sp.]|nr:hypothetical protein [Bradyrhizobium sp.]
MAIFELTAPDGGTYHVDAPDEHAAVDALGKMLGGSKASEAPAQAAAARAAEAPSTLQTIREAIHAPTRSLENGAFLGLGDRARAVVDSVLSGGGYGQHLKNEQGDTEDFRNAHPIVSPVLEGVGGVVAPLAVVGAAAKGASLGAKTLIGAGTGGGVGAVQGVLGSKDWTDLPQVGKDAAFGGAAGGAFGIMLPGASKIVGAGFEKAANLIGGRVDGMSRGAGNQLVRGVTADGPAAVQARLAELGPDAMLADAGPALLGKAQGASLNSDEGRSVLQGALTTRNEGTNARVMGDVDRALGPVGKLDDAQTATDNILAHRSAVDSVNYPAALNNAPSVKIAPIMTELIDRIDQTPVGSMEHKALSKLQEMLTKTEKQPLLDAQGFPQYDRLGNERWQDVPSSHDDAGILHKVKMEIDNVVEHDKPGLGVQPGALNNQQGSLKQVRHAINDALEMQVPGYANANRVSAALAKRATAVDLGTQYLGAGKTIASPDRFAAAFDPLAQGEKIAFAKGSRANVDRILGTKANDLQALRGELQGEGGWNTAKLATVHGQSAADELVNSVDRNLKFRDTYNKVVENSQTAQRTAAQKEMRPDPSSDTPLFNPNSTLTGMLATVGKKGVQSVANALLKSDPTRRYGEVARALTEQGSARDARLMAIIDAINSRQDHVAQAHTAGSLTSVVAALLGNAAVDRHSNAKARQ